MKYIALNNQILENCVIIHIKTINTNYSYNTSNASISYYSMPFSHYEITLKSKLYLSNNYDKLTGYCKLKSELSDLTYYDDESKVEYFFKECKLLNMNDGHFDNDYLIEYYTYKIIAQHKKISYGLITNPVIRRRIKMDKIYAKKITI